VLEHGVVWKVPAWQTVQLGQTDKPVTDAWVDGGQVLGVVDASGQNEPRGQTVGVATPVPAQKNPAGQALSSPMTQLLP
jgi:hypothetical protein